MLFAPAALNGNALVRGDRVDAHETTVDERGEKKRPDREGLSEAIGSPTAEVFK